MQQRGATSPQMSVHKPRPIGDASLVPTFQEGGVRILEKATDLDDLLAFEGEDICIFVFSTEVDDDVNRQFIDLYAQLAKEVRRNTKKLNFVAYDLNALGFNSHIGQGHPDVWFSPGNQRDRQLRQFLGNSSAEEMAEWLKKHADNKFKMKTSDLDQKMQMLKYAQESGIDLPGM